MKPKPAKNLFPRLSLILLSTILASSICCVPAFAEPETPQSQPAVSGKVISTKGKVEVKRATASDWEVATAGTVLYPGDEIKTSEKGKASLLMSDETLMQLNRNTRIEIKQVDENAGWFDYASFKKDVKEFKGSVYRLFDGELWGRNKNKNVDIKFETDNVTAGIRGTELVLKIIDQDTVQTTVLEGNVNHENSSGSLVAEAGTQVITRKGQAPVKQVLLNPIDAVQWTIRVPAVLYSVANQQSSLTAAIDELNNGLLLEAFNKLNTLTQNEPEHPNAWRLLAIAALMVNEKTVAKQSAVKALRLDENDFSNWLVLSYVQKAHFELSAAIESIQSALTIKPDDVVALNLLAQLQFGSNDTQSAWHTVQRALAIDSSNTDALSLAGFMQIARYDIAGAENAFTRALQLDSSLAESYMGLSIIHMRRGNTAKAFETITTAIALDPQRSIYLSYWGKMLYQIRRYNKAQDVLQHAEKLDPLDPTPVFYRSIVLRDLNQPGEAIQALNKAVALNDNRAVYRSRFLLDQDLAVRNVDLSRLYDQLGFDAWAQSKAMSAVKSNYMNASAHIFLAGALLEQHDRSYPFIAESLLARLFQPANANTFNTFNDYTLFYEQPNLNTELALRAGNHKRGDADIIVSGASPANHFAYNVGVFASTYDGWRDTNFEESVSTAIIGKWDTTPEDSLFASTLISNFHQGDELNQRYEYDSNIQKNDRAKTELLQIELGYKHQLSPTSSLLTYLAHVKNQADVYDHTSEMVPPFNDPNFTIETDDWTDFERPYSQAQIQYLNKYQQHQWVVGTLFLEGESKLNFRNEDVVNNTGVLTPFPPIQINNTQNVYFRNVYLKDTWMLTRTLSFEAGLSHDKLKVAANLLDSAWHIEETNPLLGIIWNYTPGMTLRLAGFRYLLPLTASRIDPVDVAGVPMYRNTQEGSLVQETSVVWEYESSRNFISINAFKLEKKLDYSNIVFDGEMTGLDIDWNYLLQNDTGLFLDYQYADLSDESNPEMDRNDQRITLGLSHVRIDGWQGKLKQTYRNMDFDNGRTESANITDIEIKYELLDKTSYFKLEVFNIFDRQFNWVTDAFVINGRNPTREALFTFNTKF